MPGVDQRETRRLYRRTLRLLDAVLREAGSGVGMTERRRDGDAEFLLALGATIQAERTRRGLSLEALAGLAGLSSALVGGIERGERIASVLRLRAIAAALGMPLPAMLDAAEATSGRSHPPGEPTPPAT